MSDLLRERADLVARLQATDGGAAGVAQYADASIETLRFVVDSAELATAALHRRGSRMAAMAEIDAGYRPIVD